MRGVVVERAAWAKSSDAGEPRASPEWGSAPGEPPGAGVKRAVFATASFRGSSGRTYTIQRHSRLPGNRRIPSLANSKCSTRRRPGTVAVEEACSRSG